MQQPAHTSKHYAAELEHIRAQVLEMGGLVEYQIRYAVEALRQGDQQLVVHVAEGEVKVNRLECEIDEACTNVIARRSPTGGDLRFLMMIYKTITDLERIGDEAKKIAKIARQPHTHERMNIRLPELTLVSAVVIDMLRRSLDGLARLESRDVPAVVRQDREVDDYFRAILRQLLTYMIEDPRTISAALDLIIIAKALERIGDHAKNISEYIVYMVSGTDVRHGSIDQIEAAAKS